MANIQLTQELVKSLFDYKDGILYWKIRPANRVHIGDKAGNFHKKIQRNVVSIYNKDYLSSRIIFLWHKGFLPKVVDHENRIRIDDRIENLREATQQQNCKNKTSHKNSTSKYLGVNYSKKYKKWVSSICSNGKTYHLGCYVYEKDAALAYNKNAVKHHGEFANLNIISP